MAADQSKTERKTAPTRRRRARPSDGDAEVNPPGEPSLRRVAPGRERRSKEMPGRQRTMKTVPWAAREEENLAHTEDGDDEDDEDEDDDFPHPGRPPGVRNE
ncbi:MAG TPA: hypothetical protein VGB18_02415 [Candidatus Thermoplasmatota archaeon]